MRRMDYSDLLTTEKVTENDTKTNMPGFNPHISQATNVLIQLQYFVGPHSDIKTFKGRYFSYCSYQFLRVPVSIRCCILLINMMDPGN